MLKRWKKAEAVAVTPVISTENEALDRIEKIEKRVKSVEDHYNELEYELKTLAEKYTAVKEQIKGVMAEMQNATLESNEGMLRIESKLDVFATSLGTVVDNFKSSLAEAD